MPAPLTNGEPLDIRRRASSSRAVPARRTGHMERFAAIDAALGSPGMASARSQDAHTRTIALLLLGGASAQTRFVPLRQSRPMAKTSAMPAPLANGIRLISDAALPPRAVPARRTGHMERFAAIDAALKNGGRVALWAGDGDRTEPAIRRFFGLPQAVAGCIINTRPTRTLLHGEYQPRRLLQRRPSDWLHGPFLDRLGGIERPRRADCGRTTGPVAVWYDCVAALKPP